MICLSFARAKKARISIRCEYQSWEKTEGITEYEKKFGRIPLPEELQNKPESPESNNSN
jgi:hypothetical protein